MIPEERRNEIINKLMEKGVTSINEFVKLLGVSRITIQRDISILEKRGLVEKIHGGVKWKNEHPLYFETLFNVRLGHNYEKKIEIAEKAIEIVQDHSTIFIDSSSTAYIFARELFKKRYLDLGIITTSPSIQHEALNYSDSKVISTGGELRHNFNMLAGRWVIDFLEKINLDSAFISTAGISPDLNITTSNPELAEVLKTVFQRTREVNLLVDSSKFFKTAMLNIGHIDQCKRIITDGGLDNETISRIKKIGLLEMVI